MFNQSKQKEEISDAINGCTYIYKEIILMAIPYMKTKAVPGRRCCGLMCVNVVNLIV